MAITSATTSLSVNTALPSAYTETGFETLTSWLNVAEISTMGSYGGTTSVVTFTPVDTAIQIQRPGSVSYGTMQMTLARHTSASMTELIEAFNDRQPRAFKVTLPAALGEVDYFTAVVTSIQTNVQGADNILETTVTLNLDNKVITAAVA